MLGMKNHFDISGSIEIAGVACSYNHSKIWTMWFYHRVMSPNNADGMANSVDPDQTAQAYLSENLVSFTVMPPL